MKNNDPGLQYMNDVCKAWSILEDLQLLYPSEDIAALLGVTLEELEEWTFRRSAVPPIIIRNLERICLNL